MTASDPMDNHDYKIGYKAGLTRASEIARKWVDDYMEGTVPNQDLDRLAAAIEKEADL